MATFNVNNFRTRGLGQGGARPTLFMMDIVGAPVTLTDFKFQCRSSQVPSKTINETEVFYFGRSIYLAGDAEFETLDTELYNDENYTVRAALEDWMDSIDSSNRTTGKTSGVVTADPSTYKAQGRITQYSATGTPVRTYTLESIQPQTLGEIELSWENKDEIEVFTVTWRYDYWTATSPGVELEGSAPAPTQ